MVGTVDRLKPVDKPIEAAKPTKSEQADLVDQKAEKAIQKQLHSKPEELTKSYDFNKITAEGADGKLKATLDRFEINDKATEYDNAVLSKDGNTLVVVNRGEVALKQYFGGTSAFSRFMYKLYGWLPRLFGGVNKAGLTAKYRELFNSDDIDMQHEPIKHVYSALKSGEYHTVSVFYKDDSGEFAQDPEAVVIVDAYDHLIEANMSREMQERSLPEADIEKRVEVAKQKFKDCFALDKMIPLSPKAAMSDLFYQVVEGLYQAQGFKSLVVPAQVHPNPNMNSNDLNYAGLDWHMITQNQEKQWQVTGDPKLLDKVDLSDEDAKEYKEKLVPAPFSPKITVVRPKQDIDKPIPPFLAYLQQWSVMSQGSDLRTTNKEDLELVELSEPVNAQLILNHNKEKQIADSLVEDLEAPWKENEAKA